MGTPGYMAPEQALGNSLDIDERTDVYGLGAILYEILTGQPPFKGRPDEVIRKVIEEPPVAPRLIDARSSPALEAICLKCLSKSRSDRYASASDLADDVKRHIADEPVTVFKEPWMTTARRWAGRHRTAAIASAAAVIVGFGILSIATVYLQAANRRAVDSMTRAEKHFGLALTAVNRFYTRIAQDERLKSQDLETLRQELLREASKFYTEIVPEQGQEPRVQGEQAQIYLDLATLTRELGRPREALDFSRKATVQFQEVARRYPEETAYRAGVARGLDSQGQDLIGTGDVPAANAVFKDAVEAWRRLAPDEADRREFLLAEAVTLNRVGRLLHFSVKHADECEEVLGRCLEVCDQLARFDARSPLYRDARAEALLNLGVSRSYRDFDRARGLLEEGLRIREELAAEHPDDLNLQSQLVYGSLQFATACSNARAYEEFPRVYRRVKDISERLTRKHPSVPFFAENDARLGLMQAIYLARHRGDYEAASRMTRESLRQAPDSGTVLVFAACAYCMCSEAARNEPATDAGRRKKASEPFLCQAIDLLRKAGKTAVFRQPGVLEGLKTTDPDFAPLRGRDDFNTLIVDLERQAGPTP